MAEETPQQKLAREQAEKTGTHDGHDWPRDAFGTPMVKISCAAAELCPTVQYGNATVGPVVVTRFIPDGGDDALRKEISKTQSLCEAAVAEDRETVAILMRSRAGTM